LIGHKLSYFGIFHFGIYAKNMKTLYSNDYQQIIAKLVKARKKAGITQVAAARKMKKPQSYISKIENCQRRVDALELKELAGLYKADIAELL